MDGIFAAIPAYYQHAYEENDCAFTIEQIVLNSSCAVHNVMIFGME